MSVNKVLLIRHGETDYNRDRRLQGDLPVPLNADGRLQAEALGLYLKQEPTDAIFASPLARAYETAQIVGKSLNLKPQADPRLQEITFGCFQGLTYNQIQNDHKNEYRMWNSGDMTYCVPDGESRRSVQHRMTSAWDELISHPDYQTIAIVSHGAAIKILLRYLFYYLPDKTVHNTSITSLSRYEKVWELESFAETPHLNN